MTPGCWRRRSPIWRSSSRPSRTSAPSARRGRSTCAARWTPACPAALAVRRRARRRHRVGGRHGAGRPPFRTVDHHTGGPRRSTVRTGGAHRRGGRRAGTDPRPVLLNADNLIVVPIGSDPSDCGWIVAEVRGGRRARVSTTWVDTLERSATYLDLALRNTQLLNTVEKLAARYALMDWPTGGRSTRPSSVRSPGAPAGPASP